MFHWTGLTPLGEIKSGHIAARNRAAAKQKLRVQTIIIKKLSFSWFFGRALRSTDITHMLQQLSRIMQTGISLIQALQVLTSCQSHPKVVALLAKIQWDLESGASFAETLAHHPRWFDPMVCAFIHLGEKTGAISPILERIASHQNKNQALKQQVKTLLMYPTVVIIMAGVVTVYLLLNVVPQIQMFFQHAHKPLPSTTLLLLNVANWIKHYGILSGCIGIASSLYLKSAYRHFLHLQHWVDSRLLSIPIIGRVSRAMYLARAFHALALAQQASLPLPDGLQWIALITGNLCYKQGFLQIRSALQQGESLRSAIVQTKLFPELVVQILSLGEESGTLSVLLSDLADYYTQSVEDSLQRLSRCSEPILMLLLGLIIGSLILSLYLPMIQLGAVL
ncbi:MAG: type II secretion system F family protein [Legionellales bacterium]|nr:type II secretion system F family protein [Legionellales bacterium]